jgi:hypothetical protein
MSHYIANTSQSILELTLMVGGDVFFEAPMGDSQ